MIEDSPVFMYYREETIHVVGNIFEMWRIVVPNINWFLAIPASEL
jgi:hypothetical protein